MRNVPSYISERLKKNIQTRANDSAPSARIWISRPSTVLVDERLLERQTVLDSSITDVSIAVSHPRMRRSNSDIFMAYISNGVAKVVTAKHKLKMDGHAWIDTGFGENASAVSIAFDGTMPKVYGSEVEFVTEQYPWLFWVDDSVLYGQKLYSDEEPVILAETNCTDVSAIRAMWSSTGGFDFGLVVFFILSGQLYYRQLIGGEWMDAELVSFGPDGVTWEEVAAFRTWDYRIGVQAKSTDGAVYELFTQFMGVGKQLTEHIEAKVDPKAKYIPIKYTNVDDSEHLEASVSAHGVTTYGLSSVPTLVRNLDDGTGNYGLFIQVVLDYPVTSVDGNVANFTLVDGNGTPYICTGCSVDEQGLVLLLEFMDFNLAEGTFLTLGYTPGTIMSPAVPMEAFSVSFEPEGLVAPDIPIPEPIEAWNTNAEGTEIALRFSQKLVGDITGLDTPVDHVQRSVDLSAATVTALNSYSSSRSPANVVDGDLSTYWRGTTAVNWIQFQLPEPRAITSIRMYMGSNYIKTFTMSGSNDGSTWTQLGGEYAAASSSTSQWYDIPIDNEDSYLYYRVDTITTYGSRIYLYEVELCETVAVGNETRLSLAGKTYDYVPGGELENTTRTIVAVSPDPEDGTVVHLKLFDGNVNSLRNLVGDVTITYSGGTWRGQGGPVEAFEFTFTPTDLQPKFHPGVSDHLSTEVVVGAILTEVHYTDLSEPEHLEAVVTPIGNLISIDDI